MESAFNDVTLSLMRGASEQEVIQPEGGLKVPPMIDGERPQPA